jgi:hypothetical protein
LSTNYSGLRRRISDIGTNYRPARLKLIRGYVRSS